MCYQPIAEMRRLGAEWLSKGPKVPQPGRGARAWNLSRLLSTTSVYCSNISKVLLSLPLQGAPLRGGSLARAQSRLPGCTDMTAELWKVTQRNTDRESFQDPEVGTGQHW